MQIGLVYMYTQALCFRRGVLRLWRPGQRLLLSAGKAIKFFSTQTVKPDFCVLFRILTTKNNRQLTPSRSPESKIWLNKKVHLENTPSLYLLFIVLAASPWWPYFPGSSPSLYALHKLSTLRHYLLPKMIN